jgi:protoporphyrin/coproporphyrin ferrochelatase
VPGVEAYQALVLVSFGAPETAEDVMPFLKRVTAGRGIPDSRLSQVAEHYYAAGGASPLNARCRELLSALQPELDRVGLKVYWGNRNWHPLLEDTIAEMRDDGVERALAFVTSAYGGYSSCRQYLDDIETARRRLGHEAPVIDKLRLYYNHPGWVGPWAAHLASALEPFRPAAGPGNESPDHESQCPGSSGGHGAPVEVIFTAHSIPVPMAANSPYVEHLTETAGLVAAAAGAAPWRLAWQSRSGPPNSPWLEPDICDVVRTSRASTMVVVPIGFVCDNMEIVYDLDVEATAVAKEKGANLVRVPTVSGSPAFAEMVYELVQERLDPDAPRRSLGHHGPWPDTCPPDHCPRGR